jgi:hypothetical protein
VQLGLRSCVFSSRLYWSSPGVFVWFWVCACVCVVLLCYGLLSRFLLNGMKHNSPTFLRIFLNMCYNQTRSDGYYGNKGQSVLPTDYYMQKHAMKHQL